MPRYTGADIVDRFNRLWHAVDVAGDRLDPDALAHARTVLNRTDERMRLGADYTIVALVGATGSGKSSMFNALAGMDLSETGVRRPTTARPMACVWGDAGVDPLLDWLEVPAAHRTLRESVLDADRELDLRGLVLLDLPDHDSTALAHRLEVDRLVELVDLLVWVVDPQKYADEALHTGYLKRMVDHDGVMVMVLNQIDRLAEAEALACERDLRRLLDDDGLESVPLVVASARTGRGVDELRSLLADIVDVQGAIVDRACADLDSAADRLMQGVAAGEPDPRRLAGADDLVAELAQSAGLPVLLDTVSADYRRRAAQATGWPFVRWAQRLRPDPLRRLGLGGAETELRALTRSAVTEAASSQQSRVDQAVRTLADGVTGALPPRWADAVRARAVRPDAALAQALDAAVDSVDLERRTPSWWQVVRGVQLLLAAVAVVGFGWLAALGLLSLVGAAPSSTPYVGPVPLPMVLLVAGLLAGLALWVGSLRAVAAGARAQRARVAAQLREAVQDVAWSSVVAPIAEVLNDHRTVRQALTGQP